MVDGYMMKCEYKDPGWWMVGSCRYRGWTRRYEKGYPTGPSGEWKNLSYQSRFKWEV